MNYKKIGLYAAVFAAGAAAAGLVVAALHFSPAPASSQPVSAETGIAAVPAASPATLQTQPPAALPASGPSLSSTFSTPISVSGSAPAAAAASAAGTDPLRNYFSGLTDANSSVYVVQSGDTLTKISKEQNVTVGLIIAANSMPNDRLQVGKKLRIPKETLSLVADKSSKTLALKAGERLVKTYRIGLGKDNSTPVGDFKIVNRLKNPTWYHDGKVIPFGSPENPLGTRWMGFDIKSYGLHGTNEPNSIGKDESLGCIRMLNAEVEELYELVPVGTPIRVTESGASASA